MQLHQLSRALRVFATIDSGNLLVHHIQIFLLVAQAGSCTYRYLEQELNLGNASVSRSVNALASNVRHRKSSYGLLDVFIDPEEGRRYRVRLSSKGHSLAKAIDAL